MPRTRAIVNVLQRWLFAYHTPTRRRKCSTARIRASREFFCPRPRVVEVGPNRRSKSSPRRGVNSPPLIPTNATNVFAPRSAEYERRIGRQCSNVGDQCSSLLDPTQPFSARLRLSSSSPIRDARELTPSIYSGIPLHVGSTSHCFIRDCKSQMSLASGRT